MNEYVELIIQSVIIVGFGLGIIHKLNMVIKNQEDQRVVIAEIKKDVHSNQEWGKDAKGKIDDHEKRINELEKDVAGLKAK